MDLRRLLIVVIPTCGVACESVILPETEPALLVSPYSQPGLSPPDPCLAAQGMSAGGNVVHVCADFPRDFDGVKNDRNWNLAASVGGCDGFALVDSLLKPVSRSTLAWHDCAFSPPSVQWTDGTTKSFAVALVHRIPYTLDKTQHVGVEQGKEDVYNLGAGTAIRRMNRNIFLFENRTSPFYLALHAYDGLPTAQGGALPDWQIASLAIIELAPPSPTPPLKLPLPASGFFLRSQPH